MVKSEPAPAPQPLLMLSQDVREAAYIVPYCAVVMLNIKWPFFSLNFGLI